MPDPPHGIGGKSQSARWLELLHRPDQSDIAFLDQVHQRHATADVVPGHRNDETQIGLDQVPPGFAITRLHTLRQFPFLFCLQQRNQPDLVWTYVVNNYLKGKQPPAFDLLYWNADSTNLPGPMYGYYLRNTYQDNKLAQPDALTMLGEPVALSAQKIEAVDVLQKTPKDSTAFFRRPTLKGDERQLVSVYTDTVEEAQKVTAGYTKAELLGCWDWWTGEITSPLAPNLVDYMPDVVTYDENGQEISRERPTEPGQIVVREYYAELPIAVRVTGKYHDMGAFAADIANLSRIVTLNDISIGVPSKDKDKLSGNLTMDATARTFRYLDPEEVQAQRSAKAGAKK